MTESKYIMKRNLVYRTNGYDKYSWTVYNADFKIEYHLDKTAKQVAAMNLIQVSAIEVYSKTNGTMGYKNLPDNIKKQIKEAYD